jgi:hypothetical protein
MSLAALKQSKSGGRGAGNGYPNVLVLFQGAELANKAGRTPDKDVLTGLLVNSVDDLVANYDEHGMPTTVVQVKVSADKPGKQEANIKHGVYEIAKGKNNNEALKEGQYVAFDRCKIRGTMIEAEYVDRPFGKLGTFNPETMYIYLNLPMSVRPEREVKRDGKEPRMVQAAVISHPADGKLFNDHDSFVEAVRNAVEIGGAGGVDVSVYIRGIAREDGAIVAFSAEGIRRWDRETEAYETVEKFAERMLTEGNTKDLLAEALSGNPDQIWEAVPQSRINYGVNSTLSGKVASRQQNGAVLTDEQKRKIDDAERFRIDTDEGTEYGWVLSNLPMQRKIDGDDVGKWYGTGVRSLSGSQPRLGRHELITANTPEDIAMVFTDNADNRRAARRAAAQADQAEQTPEPETQEAGAPAPAF